MSMKKFSVCWNTVEIKSSTPFRKMTSEQIDKAIEDVKSKLGDWSPLTEVEFSDLRTAELYYHRITGKLNFRLSHGAQYTMGIDEAWMNVLTISDDGEIEDSTMIVYDRAHICM